MLTNGNGDDTIEDFDPTHDKIDLRGSSIANYTDLKEHVYWYAKGTVFIETEYELHDKPATDHLKIVGINADDLSADNFLF